MSILPENLTNGEEIYDGTTELYSIDDLGDPTVGGAYDHNAKLISAHPFAQFRDLLKYIIQDVVIGNAKKIWGIDIDETTASAPNNADIMQYDLSTSKWVAQQLALEVVQLTPQDPAPTYAEGLFYYDATEKCFVAYNDEAEVAQCVGREIFARAYNDTGATIDNGKIVYISGAFSGRPTVALANSAEKVKSRFLGMATHSIENNTFGYIVVRGIAHNLDTSTCTIGGVPFLDNIVDGGMTNTRPTGGLFPCEIGTILTCSATEGSIYVNPSISELAAEMSRNKGFPANNYAEATLSFDNGTRIFAITPTSNNFHFYEEGIKYTKNTAQTIEISDVSGLHVIYFDEGEIAELVNPTESQVYQAIMNKPLVSFTYWNAVEGKSIVTGEERHKTQTTEGFTPRNHAYVHIHEGAVFTSGLTPTDVGTGGTGGDDADVQFGVSSGLFDDEDIQNVVNAITSTAGMEYLYLDGSIWNKGTNAGFNFPVGATPLPQYNNAGTLTEVPSGDFMLLHLFGFNDIDRDINGKVILGQNTYGSIGDARTAALTDIYNFDRTVMPYPEFVPVATFILECKTSFSNSVNARLVTTESGGDYEDFRYAMGTPSTGGSGGTTVPGGNDTEVQYNNGGTFGGTSDLTIDDAIGLLKSTYLESTNEFLTTEQASTPATPATGKQKIYCKTDGLWYTLNDAGTETAIGGGSGGAVDSVNGETGVVVLTTGDIVEDANKNYVTDTELVVIGNTSNTNTGDQDLSGLALKSNVLELDNTDAFTPDADYEPATKKYVDDNGGGSSNTEQGIAYATSITPDLSSGNVIKVGELTGNITVNNPTNPTTAEEVYIRFAQDATGGRVVTLGANYVLIDNNEEYPTTPDAIFFFSGITQSDGTIEGGFSPLEGSSTGGGTVQGSDHTYDIRPTDDGIDAANSRGIRSVDLQTSRGAASDIANGSFSIILGGARNSATEAFSIVVGGSSNKNSGSNSVIGGGKSNSIDITAETSVVAGGDFNTITHGDDCTISGGHSNTMSEDRCFIGGGYSHTASGAYSIIVGGNTNVASGLDSIVVGGWGNEASGDYTFMGGGKDNLASADYSVAIGGLGTKANKYGEQAFSSGTFSVDGDCQYGTILQRRLTAGTSTYQLYNDGSSEIFSIAVNDAYVCIIKVMAVQMDGSMGSWDYKALISSPSGVPAIKSLVGINTNHADTNIGSPTITITADTVNDALAIKVTPANSTSTRWSAKIDYAKINY